MKAIILTLLLLSTACTAAELEYANGCEHGDSLGEGYKCQSREDADDFIDDMNLDPTKPYQDGLESCFWAAYYGLDDSEACE